MSTHEPTATRVEDIPPSFDSSMTRWNRWRRAENAGRRVEPGVVGERQQRVEIGAARVGDQDRQLVDDGLARELDARHEPPHRRMEPEDRPDDLLAEHPGPVAPLHVMELVRDDGALRRRGRPTSARRAAARPGRARRRSPDAARRPTTGSAPPCRSRPADRRTPQRRSRRHAAPQRDQPPDADRDPGEPRADPGEQHDLHGRSTQSNGARDRHGGHGLAACGCRVTSGGRERPPLAA